ncbi:MAG TPA: HNH endonuclease signature motif containing protein [Bryobacteraceae bacterium]|jgi:hypothetical protein
MPAIQNQDARKLLRIISSNWATGKTLTYQLAAALMERLPPRNHSRAIGQICNLLDAAACLAGVPLFALVAVRGESGEINPKAWKTESQFRRDAIIKRSLEHRFTEADFTAISNAIEDLGSRGNFAAWKYLEGVYPGDLLFRRLTATYIGENDNAIDDLGADVPDRKKSEVWSYARDPRVRELVLRRSKGRREFCGALGFLKPDGSRYLESHHIIALANDGADRTTNVIALCPNDHREAHFGNRAEQLETGMILQLRILNAGSPP